jgi:hypothetical protein
MAARCGTAALALSVGMMLVAACSDETTPEYTPKMTDTGARQPDPCGLVGATWVNRLVGTSKMTRENATECRWDTEGDPPVSAKAGVLQVSAIIQRKRVVGLDPYSEAKAHYIGYQAGHECTALKVSVDQACWYPFDNGLNLVIRKGYIVVALGCVANRSADLEKEELENTATLLTKEILAHLVA